MLPWQVVRAVVWVLIKYVGRRWVSALGHRKLIFNYRAVTAMHVRVQNSEIPLRVSDAWKLVIPYETISGTYQLLSQLVYRMPRFIAIVMGCFGGVGFGFQFFCLSRIHANSDRMVVVWSWRWKVWILGIDKLSWSQRRFYSKSVYPLFVQQSECWRENLPSNRTSS